MTDLELHHDPDARTRDLAARNGPTVVLVLLLLATVVIAGFGWAMAINSLGRAGFDEMGVGIGLIFAYAVTGFCVPAVFLARAIRRGDPTRHSIGVIALVGQIAGITLSIACIGSSVLLVPAMTPQPWLQAVGMLALLPIPTSALSTSLIAWQSRRSPIWIVASGLAFGAFLFFTLPW